MKMSDYHKDNIYRVMSWVSNDQIKFERLEHYFRYYFRALDREQKG